MSEPLRVYATDDEDRCYYEDCWLLYGHDGLHAYHPSFSGERITPDRPSAKEQP